jgi:hypothetical protein
MELLLSTRRPLPTREKRTTLRHHPAFTPLLSGSSSIRTIAMLVREPLEQSSRSTRQAIADVDPKSLQGSVLQSKPF